MTQAIILPIVSFLSLRRFCSSGYWIYTNSANILLHGQLPPHSNKATIRYLVGQKVRMTSLPTFAARVSTIRRFVCVGLWFAALPIEPPERTRNHPITKAAAGGNDDFAQILGAHLAQILLSKQPQRSIESRRGGF